MCVCVCVCVCSDFYVLIYVCSSQYLTELLAERQKLGPFMQVLPLCTRLLNQGPFIPYVFKDSAMNFPLLFFHSF